MTEDDRKKRHAVVLQIVLGDMARDLGKERLGLRDEEADPVVAPADEEDEDRPAYG